MRMRASSRISFRITSCCFLSVSLIIISLIFMRVDLNDIMVGLREAQLDFFLPHIIAVGFLSLIDSPHVLISRFFV